LQNRGKLEERVELEKLHPCVAICSSLFATTPHALPLLSLAYHSTSSI